VSTSDPAGAPAPRVTPAANAKAMAAAIIAVAFVTGIFIGIAGDRVYLMRTRRLTPGPRIQRGVTERMLRHLDHELHFTPEQRTRVESILEQHRKRMETLMAAVRPQAEAEVAAANREIDALLDAEQKKTFAEMRAKMARRSPHLRLH
jgi:hypothetical protein